MLILNLRNFGGSVIYERLPPTTEVRSLKVLIVGGERLSTLTGCFRSNIVRKSNDKRL